MGGDVLSFIGKAVGGIVGGITGTTAAAKGAQQAAATQAAAAQLGVDETRRQFDTSRADSMPFLEAGVSALGQQGDLLGLNGTGSQSAAIEALKASPLFQSLDRTGTEALLANASATGGLRGGNLQTGLFDQRSNLLANVIQNQVGNLGQVAGQGQNTANNLGALGANSSSAISALLAQQGAATAGGQLAKGNAQQNAFNSALKIASAVAAF